MKNIQVIDGAENCVYDIFAATDKEFATIFPSGQDIAFIDEVFLREDRSVLDKILSKIWKRPIRKNKAKGIHGTLFYQLENKKIYYPNRREKDAENPDGSRLR